MGRALKEEVTWEVEVPFLLLHCSSMGVRTVGERWSGQSRWGRGGVFSEGCLEEGAFELGFVG